MATFAKKQCILTAGALEPAQTEDTGKKSLIQVISWRQYILALRSNRFWPQVLDTQPGKRQKLAIFNFYSKVYLLPGKPSPVVRSPCIGHIGQRARLPPIRNKEDEAQHRRQRHEQFYMHE
jgi:hypothetical protein